MRASEVEAGRWYHQARADLAVVRSLRAAGHHAAACFHSQQAAEKALKSVLYSQGARMVLGHASRDLARQCEAHDPVFAPLAADTVLLDQYYIATRYPNGLPSPAVPSESYTDTQSAGAEAAAERVLDAVEGFLRAKTSVLAPPSP